MLAYTHFQVKEVYSKITSLQIFFPFIKNKKENVFIFYLTVLPSQSFKYIELMGPYRTLLQIYELKVRANSEKKM